MNGFTGFMIAAALAGVFYALHVIRARIAQKRAREISVSQSVRNQQIVTEFRATPWGWLCFATVADPHTLIMTTTPTDAPQEIGFDVHPVRLQTAEAVTEFVTRHPSIWKLRFLHCNAHTMETDVRHGGTMVRSEEEITLLVKSHFNFEDDQKRIKSQSQGVFHEATRAIR